MREQFMRRRCDGEYYPFSVTDRLPMRLIWFAVREAEKNRDEFWQMICAEIAGDVVGIRLPHSILRKLYDIGIKYDDWSIRSAVAMRRELPRNLYVRMLSDPEEEVRRHFVIAHKDSSLSCVKIMYLDVLTMDVNAETDRNYVNYAIQEASRYLMDKDDRVRASALKMLLRVPIVAWRLCARPIAQCLFDRSSAVRLQAHTLLRLSASREDGWRQKWLG